MLFEYFENAFHTTQKWDALYFTLFIIKKLCYKWKSLSRDMTNIYSDFLWLFFQPIRATLHKKEDFLSFSMNTNPIIYNINMNTLNSIVKYLLSNKWCFRYIICNNESFMSNLSTYVNASFNYHKPVF